MSVNNEKGRDRVHMSASAERLGRSGVNELMNWRRRRGGRQALGDGEARYQAARIQKQHEQQSAWKWKPRTCIKVCFVGLRIASLPLSECVCDGLEH